MCLRSGRGLKLVTRHKDPFKTRVQSSITAAYVQVNRDEMKNTESRLLFSTSVQGLVNYSVMRSTRLPLGGVMLSGKKFTKVSKS